MSTFLTVYTVLTTSLAVVLLAVMAGQCGTRLVVAALRRRSEDHAGGPVNVAATSVYATSPQVAPQP